MNGAWKMVSIVGVLNPEPLGHESSALTTRPLLLLNKLLNFGYDHWKKVFFIEFFNLFNKLEKICVDKNLLSLLDGNQVSIFWEWRMKGWVN